MINKENYVVIHTLHSKGYSNRKITKTLKYNYDKIYNNYIDLEIKITKNGDNDLEISNSAVFEIITPLNSYCIKIYSDIKPYTNKIALDIAKVINSEI